jgi:hypothetical protein
MDSARASCLPRRSARPPSGPQYGGFAVQTFLPYADFALSAAALDSARLGKQRVEVLQILRAITFPSYGWTNHPATQMWRGYVPALTSYGLAMVDAWTGRGAADSTRAQIAEFAVDAVGASAGSLAMPSWLGNEALHRSHQSNLIRKFPEFYGPKFPGVPETIEYLWPGADALPPSEPLVGRPLLILRPRDDAQLAGWIARGEVSLDETSPLGKRGPKWMAQRALFAQLPIGTRFAALGGDGGRLFLGEILDGLSVEVHEGANPSETFWRSVRFEGELARSAFPYPALLQDPRTLFETTGPVL